MSGDLRIENILIQVRSKLQENGIKLWLSPYYDEGIGSVDDEIEVMILFDYCEGYCLLLCSWFTFFY